MKIRRLIAVMTACIIVVMLGATPAFAKTKDVNHNGIPDKWETKYKMSIKKNLASADFDKDGLTNLNEYRAGTSPRAKDTNHNGVADGWENPDKDGLINLAEVASKTDPRVADTNHNKILDGKEDPDRDRLTNAQEWQCRTNPLVACSNHSGVSDFWFDTDHDGLANGNEFALGDNPSVADSDHDGVPDGQEVSGVVTNFDGETLSVDSLRKWGTSYELLVTDATVIQWAAIVNTGTVPTVDDLQAGALISEAEGQVQADGSVVATVIRLIPMPETAPPIAQVSCFDGSHNDLHLTPSGGGDDYQVRVTASTVYAWADGIYSDHAPTATDLHEGTGVTQLVVGYTTNGTMYAKRLVLVPSYAIADPGTDGATDPGATDPGTSDPVE